MKKLIEDFGKQLTQAISIGEKAQFTQPTTALTNIVIAGLGGSGIGGSIVSELVFRNAKLPITVIKGYDTPAFINEHTLFIASSYSGNTEETLETLSVAIAKKCKVVCVTSGGKVAEIAKQNNLDCVLIPGGMPPRSCAGYSLTQLFFILKAFGVINFDFLGQLKKAVALLNSESAAIHTEAKEVAAYLNNKIPVIYSTNLFEGVAIRFRQQINENAKMLCWHNVVPEMNHNELVGWKNKHEDLAVIIFRDKEDYQRNQKRIEINKEIIKQYTSNIMEVYCKGESQLEKAIYFIHLGDWISFYLAELRQVDIVEVKVIDFLKSELAKI
ncbi:MAG: bifunctional phosphoglucose/phosphomannose isomerase [Bacteroidetes bacterium]|nr:bifunctional phosphoglucose/phosphomannose isomerase [Bacteroidota bacterium]